MKLFYVAKVMTLSLTSAALLILNSGLTFGSVTEDKRPAEGATEKPWPTTVWTTPGTSRANLNGKMFTLSSQGGGIRFSPTNYFIPTQSPWSTPATTERPTTPYSTPHPHWTTAPPYRGVSVCLRYLSDSRTINPFFTLSPSTNPLRVGVDSLYGCSLSVDYYYYSNPNLKPDIRYWSNIDRDIWTKVCLTVDSMRNVAQVFSGFSMSIRKILPFKFVWSGEPVVYISGFDGQVTDLQVWDYPIRYKEVFNYMTRGVYVPYQGNVLTWSSISFSLSGNTLLEDIYENRESELISNQRGRGQRQREEKKARTLIFTREESEGERQWFK